jgi:cytochrome c1
MAFTKKLGFVAAAVFGVVALSSLGLRAEEGGHAETPNPERQTWSFAGPFGTFDRAQLQRGFKIYKEVCSNCHELHIPIRTLGQPGGPEFSEAQVKALAATYTVHDGPNLAGEMFDRPGRPADYFPSPFPNQEAAAASLGAAPPDMSLLAKSIKFERGFPNFVFDALPIPGVGMYQEVGPDLIYAILNGYTKDDDANWNLYFPGHKIAMGKPLSAGQVDYTDGTPTTLPQYSKDVAAFLYWAAEPSMEQRKRIGARVLIFLIVLAGMLYFTKKRIWSGVAH